MFNIFLHENSLIFYSESITPHYNLLLGWGCRSVPLTQKQLSYNTLISFGCWISFRRHLRNFHSNSMEIDSLSFVTWFSKFSRFTCFTTFRAFNMLIHWGPLIILPLYHSFNRILIWSFWSVFFCPSLIIIITQRFRWTNFLFSPNFQVSYWSAWD